MTWFDRLFETCSRPLARFGPLSALARLQALRATHAPPRQFAAAVDAVLTADHRARHRNVLVAPARAALLTLKAAALLEDADPRGALAASKLAVALQPEEPPHGDVLRRAVDMTRGSVAAHSLIALIFTSDRRQERCQRLYRTLSAHGWTVLVVCGRGARRRHAYEYLMVGAGDGYEGLCEKVRDALCHVVESYAPAAAVKLDDDTSITDGERFTRAIRAMAGDPAVDYAGERLATNALFRDWHFNKCLDPNANVTPLGRRITAPFAYAYGPCYYLSPKAVDAYYHFNVRYPDEILGFRSYEDVYMGRVLSESGIGFSELEPVRIGVELERTPPGPTLTR